MDYCSASCVCVTNLPQKSNGVKQSFIKLTGSLVEELGLSIVGMACLCPMIFVTL